MWDFQIQLLHFQLDRLTLLPRFRLIDNEGFGNLLSTHTKHGRPWNFFGHGYSKQIPSGSQPNKTEVSLFWRFIDSNLWAADGHFTSRARKTGIRTYLRQKFK